MDEFNEYLNVLLKRMERGNFDLKQNQSLIIFHVRFSDIICRRLLSKEKSVESSTPIYDKLNRRIISYFLDEAKLLDEFECSELDEIFCGNEYPSVDPNLSIKPKKRSRQG